MLQVFLTTSVLKGLCASMTALSAQRGCLPPPLPLPLPTLQGPAWAPFGSLHLDRGPMPD